MDQGLNAIRLVTERYSELKGLHVAYAGALWVCFGTALYLQGDVNLVTLMAAFLGAVVAYLPGKWRLDRYYRLRFGQIVVSPWRRSKWLFPALMAVAGANLLFGGGPMGYAFLVITISSLKVAIRDWPERGHHLVGCAAGALAASMQFAQGSGKFGKPEALGIAIIGLSYIAVGLLDHRVLTSVLGHRQHPAAVRSADSR